MAQWGFEQHCNKSRKNDELEQNDEEGHSGEQSDDNKADMPVRASNHLDGIRKRGETRIKGLE